MPTSGHAPRPRRSLAGRILRWTTALALLIVVVAAALVTSHVHRIWGGYVERVDPAPFRVEPQLTAITNVQVLAPDGDSMLPARTVVFDGTAIRRVTADTLPPADARVIDGNGGYLIPGLVDAHVHLRRQPNDLLLYLATGVTHVREFSGSPRALAWRNELAAGRPGPHLYVASPLVYTTGLVSGWFVAWTQPRYNVRRAEQAEAAVAALRDAGYDAIKTYADLDRDVFRALNTAARAAGVHTVGHLPDGFVLDSLRTTDQREIAHVEEIVKKLQDEYDRDERGPYAEGFVAFVAERADAVIDDLLANDLTVNSTLWFMEVVGRQAFGLEQQLSELPIEYANPAMLEGSPYVAAVGWLPGRNQFEVTDDPEPDERRRIEASWEARAEAHRTLFRRMVERGVRIVAGTDATTHLVVPGFSLHAELASLVRNGMTPADALRAATATPAALMASNAGRIEAGRRADLVLLAADPLADIANVAATKTVIVGGRVYERPTLDAMLARVEQANAASRSFDLARYRVRCDAPTADDAARPGRYAPASTGCATGRRD